MKRNLTLAFVTFCSVIFTYLYPIIQIHISTLEKYSYLFTIMADIYEIPLSFGIYFGFFLLLHSLILSSLNETLILLKKVSYITLLALCCIKGSELLYQAYYKDLLDSFNNPNMVKAVVILSVALLFANIFHSMVKLFEIRIEKFRRFNEG